MSDQNSHSEPIDSKSAEILQDFLEDEILKTQDSLRRSRLFGVIVIVIVTLYMGYITNGLRGFLQPDEAAKLTTMFISDQVTSKADLLAVEIKSHIPKLIEELPEHFLKEIPRYRQSLEDTVVTATRTQMQGVAGNLDEHLNAFMDTHQKDIKKMLSSTDEVEVTEALKESLADDVVEFLNTVPPNGESVTERIAKSLEVLSKAEAVVDRLAQNKNLSPAEKKTRYALAVLAGSISEKGHELEMIKRASKD
ncbi:MAG: hypothetical protein ACPGVU_16790 [Limisphaerales bacterium]